jgi:signal transduction histidine kinase
MKRRTFILTLLLFLLTVHGCIALITVKTYKGTLNQARERAAAGHYYIASGLLRDIAALNSRGVDYRQGAAGLAEPYGYIALNQNAGISLYYEEAPVYANFYGETYEIPALQDSERRIGVEGTSILVAGKLAGDYGGYTLLYRYDMSEAIIEWRSMRNIMWGAGLVFSGIMAVGLLILLEMLFKPLQDISRTSQLIAGGGYSTRLAVKGRDELGAMAASFNHMAGEIERQMDELTAAAENKQLFIDNFAHELKTPLTAIYGYAEYMQKADISEEVKHFALSCVMSESRRIHTMALQMMELAGLRNDQICIERLDVSQFFAKVERTMKPAASAKGIDLRFNCEIPEIHGDSILLESLLSNLIDNAVKASAEGSAVSVKAYSDAGVPVITVEDRGKGIPAEALSRLTQPYYRVEKHRHRRDGGAGLGLAICEQIAEKHGGRLSFKSVPGSGTTVQIIFTTPT